MAAGAGTSEGELNDALPFSKLELTLRLSKTEYVLGEPIAVYARLANPHAKPVQAHEGWGWFRRGGTRWEGGEVDLYVELARDGKTLDINRPYGMSLGLKEPPDPCLIPAGAVRLAKQLIVYGNPKVDRFLAPGTVKMTVKLRGIGWPPETVASNPAEISIRAPQGPDAEAYEWLCERKLLPYLGYLLFLRRSFEDEDIQALKTFLEKYSETAYGPYARFSLGQMYFHRGRYEEAIQEFSPFALRHRDAPVAEDARYLAGESYRILLKPLEADHVLRLLIRFHPDTPAAEDAEDLRRHLRGAPFRGRNILLRDDPRLDVTITFEVPSHTLIEDVFKVVSRLSGVPLRVAPEPEDTRFLGRLERTVTLRAFMDELERSTRRWVRDGDGYRLVPALAPEPQRSPPAKPKPPHPRQTKP